MDVEVMVMKVAQFCRNTMLTCVLYRRCVCGTWQCEKDVLYYAPRFVRILVDVGCSGDLNSTDSSSSRADDGAFVYGEVIVYLCVCSIH